MQRYRASGARPVLGCPSITSLGPTPAPPRHPPSPRPAGVLLLSLLCAASIYTSYLLAVLHELPNGTRLNTYKEMGEALLGMCGAARCETCFQLRLADALPLLLPMNFKFSRTWLSC